MNLSPDAWQTVNSLGVAGLAALSGVLIALVARNNKTTKGVGGKVEDATAAAEEARDNAAPVSNGYTGKTIDLLEIIRDDVKAIRDEAAADRKLITDHIADHARGGLHVPRQRDRSFGG